MSAPIHHLLTAMAASFEKGDLEAVARHFSEPLAIFANGQFMLEATASRVPELIFRMRAEAIARGMASVRLEIINFRPTRNNRTPVVADWHFIAANGKEIGTSRVCYYCAPDRRGELRVEMLEYIEIAFPNFLRDLSPEPAWN